MKKTFLLLFLLAAVLGQGTASARYSDEIAVSVDEVWKAAKNALGPIGLRKVDDKNFYLETKWIVDRIKRRNKLLLDMPSQEYDRRYRMKIQLKDRSGDTAIEIKGVFQQKNPNIEQKTWSVVLPKADDLDVEQEIFMKILNELAKSRNDMVG